MLGIFPTCMYSIYTFIDSSLIEFNENSYKPSEIKLHPYECNK